MSAGIKLEIEVTDEMMKRLQTLADSKGLSVEDVAKFILADAMMSKATTSLGQIVDDVIKDIRKFFPFECR